MTSSLNKRSYPFVSADQTQIRPVSSPAEISINALLKQKDAFERVVGIIQEYYPVLGDQAEGLAEFFQFVLVKAQEQIQFSYPMSFEAAQDYLEEFIVSEFANQTNYFDLAAGLEPNLLLL